MKNLKLTQEEENIIVTALDEVVSIRFKLIRENRDLLGEDAVKEVVKTANKYSDLKEKLFPYEVDF